MLERSGAAAVVREADCDGKSLYETAKAILSDAGRMRAMRASARDMAVVDAAERIYQTALDLAKALTRTQHTAHRMGKIPVFWRNAHASAACVQIASAFR